ncbi:MAG: hypothetical protein ACK42C_01130 [Aquificaceae bacterium]
MFLVFLYSCGGGAKFSESPLTVDAKVEQEDLLVRLSEPVEEKVNLLIKAQGGGVIPERVRAELVRLDYYSVGGSLLRTRSETLNFSLTSGEQRKVSFSVFSLSDKLNFKEPLMVHELGIVSCTRDNNNNVFCQKEFSGELPEEPVARSCVVMAGNLKLVEGAGGIFSGDGTGLRRGKSVEVYFTTQPQEGLPVYVSCLSKEESLNVPYRIEIFVETDRGRVFAGSVYLKYGGLP